MIGSQFTPPRLGACTRPRESGTNHLGQACLDPGLELLERLEVGLEPAELGGQAVLGGRPQQSESLEPVDRLAGERSPSPRARSSTRAAASVPARPAPQPPRPGRRACRRRSRGRPCARCQRRPAPVTPSCRFRSETTDRCLSARNPRTEARGRGRRGGRARSAGGGRRPSTRAGRAVAGHARS
jgi:hypothetical protein